MIRQPTSQAAAYAWHTAAVAGERPATFEDDCQCGWFRTRMVKNGPWVPAKIWLEQEIDEETGELLADEVFRALLDGENRSPDLVWQRACGNPITEEAFLALCDLRERTPSMLATHVPYQPEGFIRP